MEEPRPGRRCENSADDSDLTRLLSAPTFLRLFRDSLVYQAVTAFLACRNVTTVIHHKPPKP